VVKLKSESEVFKMKATGIVRRIDDLGRIMIPKEIRRTLRIKDGDPFEIFIEDGGVFYKKYSPMGELKDFAQTYADSLYKTTGNVCIITDRDSIIVVSGMSKKEFLDKPVSSKLERIMDDREKLFTNTESINIIEEQITNFHSMIVYPIISEGDAVGSVILAENKTNIDFGAVEGKLIENAVIFLGKRIEE